MMKKMPAFRKQLTEVSTASRILLFLDTKMGLNSLSDCSATLRVASK